MCEFHGEVLPRWRTLTPPSWSDDTAHGIAVKRSHDVRKDFGGRGERNKSGDVRLPLLGTNAADFAIPTPRRLFNRAPGRSSWPRDRCASNKEKEETEGRQEPQKGRRRAGQSVRGGQDPGGPEPNSKKN